MSDSEQPKAGQWWLHSNGNVMFIAFDERTIKSECVLPILAYAEDLESNWFRPDEFVRRLPDDAGFDWKPETEYPQYWTCLRNTPIDYAFVKRISEKQGVVIKTDGSQSGGVFRWSAGCQDTRTQLTKEQAEALLDKPAVFDTETFTSDWGPFEQQPKQTDRWFIWSDDRYQIAFVKHVDGKVQNLNVDLVLKQSDDWNHGYEEQLTNGELIEVTEFSAKAFLKRPRSTSKIPKHEPPKSNRIPVRLWCRHGSGRMYLFASESPPVGAGTKYVEIKFDPQLNITDSGFYIEGGK